MDCEIKYYLVKVLPSAKTITSNYGDLELDDELRRAVIKALTPILEKRLSVNNNIQEEVDLPATGIFDKLIAEKLWRLI